MSMSTMNPLVLKSKFIHFVRKERTTRVNVWSCCNNKTGDELGEIAYDPLWHKYCYIPTIRTIYSVEHLAHIQAFILELERITS